MIRVLQSGNGFSIRTDLGVIYLIDPLAVALVGLGIRIFVKSADSCLDIIHWT